MKKFKLRTIVIGFSFLAGVTTVVLLSGVLSKVSLINAAGSSAVQPLMVAFSNKYYASDLVTQAGGSGAGIRAAIDGSKDIGLASKNPGVLGGKKPEDEKAWINRQIKTVTIAWDGIGIVYKPSSKTAPVLDINQTTINLIYKAFAGNKKITLSELGVEGDNTLVSPYARSGGSVVSGTADAFLKDSNLKPSITPEDKDILINGNYGPNTKTTAESNSQAWSFVKNENKVGAMTYLSAGFINNNSKEILENGFKIATYKSININANQIASGYNWYRPLNLMLPIRQDLFNRNSQELINWILANPIAKTIIEKEGYVALTDDEILKLMCINNDKSTFWTSDDKAILDNKPKVIK